MDNSVPADAILGNRHFIFETDPEYFVVLQQGLEVARKEATPLPTTELRDWLELDGTINSLKAGEFYHAARVFLEIDVFKRRATRSGRPPTGPWWSSPR